MKLFIPNEYHKTIHDIDLVQLYEQGIRLILTDLDNTLVGYETALPTEEIIGFKQKTDQLGIKVVIISNNKEIRVKKFADKLGVEFASSAKKPLKRNYRRFLTHFKQNEIAIIGDQVMTDVIGGNRMGFYTILVDVINYKNEQFKTKFNRFVERKIIKRYKIKDDQNGKN
jgi:HAD superfamily phosphatase (TIGR01668 family)